MDLPREITDVTEITAELSCDAASAAAARNCIQAALRVWALDDLADVAILLTSELVANAVIHARSAIRVVARRTPPEVVVEVFDASPDLPVPGAGDPGRDGGRGLLIVDRLASRWGVEPAESGKVVWFALRAA